MILIHENITGKLLDEILDSDWHYFLWPETYCNEWEYSELLEKKGLLAEIINEDGKEFAFGENHQALLENLRLLWTGK